MRGDRVADLLQLSEKVAFIRVEVLGLNQLLPPLAFDPGPHSFYRIEVGRRDR